MTQIKDLQRYFRGHTTTVHFGLLPWLDVGKHIEELNTGLT